MVKFSTIPPVIGYALLMFYAGIVWTVGYTPYQRNILKDDYDYYRFRVKEGDHPDWAKPEIDDSNWDAYISDHSGTYWIRAEIQLIDDLPEFRKRGLKAVLRGSYDLYWDGHLIGKNGIWGHSKDTEEPGLYRQLFIIPDSLCGPGHHMIAMRISNNHDSYAAYPKIQSGDYLKLSREPLVLTIFVHIIAGIFLVSTIYYFFLYFLGAGRKNTFLIFGTFCFSLLLLTIFEYMKFYYNYPYPFQKIRLQIIEYLTFFSGILLPIFYLHQFRRPHKYQLISGLFIIFLLELFLLDKGPDHRAYYLIYTGIISSLFISYWAYCDQKPMSEYAIAVLIMCSICLLVYFDLLLFIGFGLLVIVSLYFLARQRMLEKKKYEQSLLRASRMEIELLKKNIQPHFIMNTLTSLIQVIEESPKIAVEFIHSLAGLFELLQEISSLPVISVRKELELCRAHLKVMEYRKDMKYELITSNIDDKESIPPAVFLTIIENGLSHNRPRGNTMSFYINFVKGENWKRYTIFASGESRNLNCLVGNGIGHQYVKARLEEAYKGKWNFRSAQNGNGWETRISIHSKN